ncbi:MAG TPA: hypothetical protein VGM24_03005, partial [Puia sp.]
LRLAKAFGTTAELWLNMQRNFDLWNASRKIKLSQVKVLRRAKTDTTDRSVLKGKTLRPSAAHA